MQNKLQIYKLDSQYRVYDRFLSPAPSQVVRLYDLIKVVSPGETVIYERTGNTFISDFPSFQEKGSLFVIISFKGNKSYIAPVEREVPAREKLLKEFVCHHKFTRQELRRMLKF